jgi:serine/threonine protein kinase
MGVFFSQAFLAIIESIHKAGVRHLRDISADNLLIDCNTGQAFIIDFDQAEIARPRTNFKVEVQCLQFLLEGQYMHMTYELYN